MQEDYVQPFDDEVYYTPPPAAPEKPDEIDSRHPDVKGLKVSIIGNNCDMQKIRNKIPQRLAEYNVLHSTRGAVIDDKSFSKIIYDK